MSSVLVMAAVSAAFLKLPLCSSGADLDADHSDTIAPSFPVAPTTSRNRIRFQLRIWEFAPHNGEPDPPPESARDVDQLYEVLIHWTPSKCLQPASACRRESGAEHGRAETRHCAAHVEVAHSHDQPR
jgi:hypothetical protein